MAKNVPVPTGAVTVIVPFIVEKETPGTFRFQEVGEKEDFKVGAIYLKKSTYAALGSPKGIKVTITAAN